MMKNGKPLSGRLIFRYILFQLPGLIVIILLLLFLRQWVNISSWLIVFFIALWITKDIILYPFVWRAYDSYGKNMHAMTGMKGIVIEKLSPSGYIKLQGESWRAELINGGTVEKGTIVDVIDVRGLTLFVEPEEKSLN